MKNLKFIFFNLRNGVKVLTCSIFCEKYILKFLNIKLMKTVNFGMF